jgi:hypothetical protein
MNKPFKICIAFFLVLAVSAFSRKLINEVLVIIYHEMGTVAVLASDIRPGLDGRMRTLREVILNKLMQFDALYHKIVVTPEQADQYIENIQKENRLSKKAVEDLFREAGYTYQEAREYLRSRQMIEQVVEFRVKSDKRMIVSRAEAEARYKENPPATEPLYTLAIAFVSQEQLGKKRLEEYLASINLEKDLIFDEPLELKESEIAADRQIITTKEPGEIVFIEPVEGGFEITRLVKKVPAGTIPFDDCYHEIAIQMRKERLKEVFDGYYKLLLSQATLRFTHPEDAKVLESSEDDTKEMA